MTEKGDSQKQGKLDVAGLRKLLGVSEPSKEVAETIKHLDAARKAAAILSSSQHYSRDMQALLRTQTELLMGRQHASRLAARHNEMVVSEQFIAALELMLRNDAGAKKIEEGITWDPMLSDKIRSARSDGFGGESLLQELKQLRTENGFFISRYDDALEMQRLEGGEFVIMEGSIPDPRNTARQMPITDSQVHVPRTDVTAPVFELPDVRKGDVPVMDKSIEDALRHPAAFAVMEDISCVREYSNAGYAGHVRDKAFEHIRTQVNAARPPEAKIRNVMAAIAGLQGMERPDGSRVLLSEVSSSAILLNERSWIAHQKSRYEGQIAYYLDKRRVPVQIGEDTYHLLVRWYYFTQPITPLGQKKE